MNIAERIASLPRAREHRGSRVRCLLLTDGTSSEVAARLTDLAEGWAVVDSDRHHWLPKGFENMAEARIGQTPGFIPDHRKALIRWWLDVSARPHNVHRGNIPNWDIASTADIGGERGLILVEAKAHVAELGNASGKKLKADAVQDSRANHEGIKIAIQAANDGLETATSVKWQLSRDSHYQLANRFAWVWKIASLGVPVALVYLGFIAADEMSGGRKLIANGEEWERIVKDHARGIVPDSAWNETIDVAGTPMRALIQSKHIDIPRL
jgi:hypothetical protein